MMNALEKIHLIKELHQLGHDLEHRNLSLYEVARSQKRVHEIFLQCNEPIFKKQILAFKTRTQPETAAEEFAKESHYYYTYRGFFQDQQTLQTALYTHPLSGWAFLHDYKRGWQIWLIPSPNSQALVSEWTDIEQSFKWLLHQQELSSCLKADMELQAAATTLSLEMIEDSFPAPSINPYISKREIREELSAVQDLPSENSVDPQAQTLPAAIDTIDSVREEPQPGTIEKAVKIEVPTSLQWQGLSFQVSEFNFAENQNFYQLEVEYPDIENHVKIAWYNQKENDLNQQPVYLAEQVDHLGRFSHYAMLLGVQEWQKAIELIQLWGKQAGYRITAIKSISSVELGRQFLQLDSLYHAYSQQARLIWQQENYCLYLPLYMMATKKLIIFDEAEAEFNTPLLLLEERQKLWVIHGEKRLSLSSSEQVYPCLILKRDQQINWQMIHQIIRDFKEPIEVHVLYDAILSKALEKLM
ncbi:hypothetical protein ABEF86_01310 [Acinetobacter thermotolerans]|uniref:hypothetical protein n=1 Tax=Acinetobacter thermotolerans TaxID=3151487 RepID=UPI00325C2FB5